MFSNQHTVLPTKVLFYTYLFDVSTITVGYKPFWMNTVWYTVFQMNIKAWSSGLRGKLRHLPWVYATLIVDVPYGNGTVRLDQHMLILDKRLEPPQSKQHAQQLQLVDVPPKVESCPLSCHYTPIAHSTLTMQGSVCRHHETSKPDWGKPQFEERSGLTKGLGWNQCCGRWQGVLQEPLKGFQWDQPHTVQHQLDTLGAMLPSLLLLFLIICVAVLWAHLWF